jgi:Protein of unknown function (DUF3180)
VTPSRYGVLVFVFAAALTVSWALLHLMQSRGNILPTLPWSTPALVLVVDVTVLFTALSLRARLRGRPGTRPPQPIRVARSAVLGKASAHAGALLAGGYAGYGLVLLPDLTGRRDQVYVVGAAVVASALLTVAGLALERVCRVRGPRDEPPEDADG